ncbi:DUF3137 domain-containing protein [Faecalibacterium duncaniae]|nr:DUF3137 domain-containing protein [Faecalibacterium duncaniae]PDX65664.1 DUF3137 domain-containing protein [Faecalibacterium prausnitzii]PDX77502.1 DUF3137 domain-containing protein [Faecalibacterium prausnitzii]
MWSICPRITMGWCLPHRRSRTIMPMPWRWTTWKMSALRATSWIFPRWTPTPACTLTSAAEPDRGKEDTMPYGMLFVIAVVLLLGWLHSSRKEAARQDADRRIVPVVLDAVFQEVQFAPNGRITCFGESGLPLPQYDRMTGGEHVRAKYRGYEVELCSIELDRDVSYTDPDDPTVVNAPSYDTVYAGLWGICRYGTPMPVSLTFTPRGKLGQLVRSASVQNPVDGFEQQFKLTADDDTARNVCLTEEKCRKLLALAGTAEGSFSGSLHRDGTLYFAVENNKGLFKGSGSDDVLREKFARQLKWCTDVMDVFAP